MALVARPFESTPDGSTGSLGGPINGLVEISLGILDHHFRRLGQRNSHLAALVLAATWSVEVGQADAEARHLCGSPSESEMDPAFGVRAQGGREVKTQSLNVDMHYVSPLALPMAEVWFE